MRVLAERFLTDASVRLLKPPAVFSPGALEVLDGHSWPDNVRELRDVIDRAALLATTGTIDAKHVVIDPR